MMIVAPLSYMLDERSGNFTLICLKTANQVHYLEAFTEANAGKMIRIVVGGREC